MSQLTGTAERRARLHQLLERPRVCQVPGVTNPLFAKLAEEAGIEAVFLTGAGLANTMLAVPDLGLTTLSETVEAARRMAEVTRVPVIADADTGYGNHLNVVRVVSELEAVGVAGLILEDQVAPKRCGHFEGKAVVPVKEMVDKLAAATMTRRDPDLVIIARTDAIAVEGLDAALGRARVYAAAGADAIFVEAPRTIEQLAAIPPAVPAPCVANMVEGGRTPLVSAEELGRMGYRLAIYANLALRVAVCSVARAFETLKRDGSSEGVANDMLSWEKRQELVGLREWQELDEAIAERSERILRGSGDPMPGQGTGEPEPRAGQLEGS